MPLKPLPPAPVAAIATAIAALAAALWAPPGAHAAEATVQLDSITWLSADPSIGTGGGSQSGTGPAYLLQQFMQEQLPRVRQPLLQANAKRSWQMLANGEQVCQESSVRTPERELIAYFTDTQVSAPLQLIVRRDKLELLPRNAAGEVELVRLLADGRLRAALVDGRSYGQLLDRQLTERPAGKTVTFYGAADFGSQILPMVVAGRADYTIDYDLGLGRMREREPGQGALLTALPIQGATELMRAGVACPRTPWGLAAITAIDRALGTPAGAAMLRRKGERWLTPEVRLRYAAQIEQFYKERARPSQIR